MELNSNLQAEKAEAFTMTRRQIPHMRDTKIWHERLKEAFAAKRWSMAELSRRSGVTYDKVNKYLRGEVENPRGTALDDIAAALGVPVAWLMGFDENGAPFFAGEPSKPDPGPLNDAATIRALRAVLSALMSEEAVREIPDKRMRAAADSASDAWRALARQGHTLEAAFAPTIQSFFLRGKGPSLEEIRYAAEVAADVYQALLPLAGLPRTG